MDATAETQTTDDYQNIVSIEPTGGQTRIPHLDARFSWWLELSASWGTTDVMAKHTCSE